MRKMNKRLEKLNSYMPDGYAVTSYSPGDGTTRYKIVPAGLDYWEHDGLARALGYRDAETMVSSFRAGYYAAREEES